MSLTRKQINQLLAPINPSRVLHADGQSHVAQQDVRAHLTRIFGFGGWDLLILDLQCIRDTEITVPPKNNKPERVGVPAVTYTCTVRLIVRDPDGNTVATFDDVGTGTSPNLPTYGDAHDFAAKNAVSYALKRCAVNLGDQFGLSLYNGGQTAALVRGTLVRPDGPDGTDGDVQAGVPPQTSMGDERPAEPRLENTVADGLNRVKAAAEALHWDNGDLRVNWARDHDGQILEDADAESLIVYAVKLELLRAA